MNEKFRYSPGLPGYGTPGIDGSAGSNGLSTYFTDLDTVNDQTVISSRIQNNQFIWSGAAEYLPEGKVYQTGDIFIDSKGQVYEIDLSRTSVYFFAKNMKLSASQLFSDSYVTELNQLGLQRWANTHDSDLIDNIFTENAIDYTSSPATINNISPIDFTRIEYTDFQIGSQNAFTAYIADNVSDNSAIAITRNINDNAFHIGNLNDSLTDVRDVDLTIDVRNFKVSKNTKSQFDHYEDSGTVLTNYEIAANPLFEPNFTINPASFKLTPISTNQLDISWNKCDFLNTTDANILNNTFSSLYFFKDNNPYNGTSRSFQTFDSSTLIFNNLDVSGKISITPLVQTTNYGAYILFNYNGWTRTSKILSATTGTVATINASENTTHSKSISADASGWFTTASSYTDVINVSSNTNWTSNIAENWITITPTYGSGPTTTITQVDVSLSRTLSNSTRTGTIKFNAGSAESDIAVTQYGVPIPVTASMTFGTQTNGGSDSDTHIDQHKVDSITITGLPADTLINIDVAWNMDIRNNTNNAGGSLYYNNIIAINATGKTTASTTQSGTLVVGDTAAPSGTVTMTNVGTSNLGSITVGMYNDAYITSGTVYRFSSDIRITSVTLTYVSGSNISTTWTTYTNDYCTGSKTKY